MTAAPDTATCVTSSEIVAALDTLTGAATKLRVRSVAPLVRAKAPSTVAFDMCCVAVQPLPVTSAPMGVRVSPPAVLWLLRVSEPLVIVQPVSSSMGGTNSFWEYVP